MGGIGAMQAAKRGPVPKAGTRVAFMVFVQVMAGFANIYLLAPVWMQLVHLLTADVLWITVVLLACEQIRTGECRAWRPTDSYRGRALVANQLTHSRAIH